jgi:hypothetical protein
MTLLETTKAACSSPQYSSSCVDEYIYQRPIRVPLASSHADDFQCAVAFILIFNLALAHHTAGLDEDRDWTTRQAELKKALRFYSLAHQSLEQQDQGNEASAQVFFLLALTNNKGQICKVLGETDNARAFFEYLLETLVYLNDCEWEWESSNDRHSLLKGFYQSTLHLILTKSHTAEAA